MENRRDQMTGLYHKSEIPRFIAGLIEKGREETEHLSMIIIDIDDIKGINDYHGLPCGDYAIRELAALLVKNVPENSFLARSGGDEFTIVLPHTAYESAQLLALHLCDVAADHNFLFKYNHEQEFKRIPIRISAGVAGIHTNVSDATVSLMYDIVSLGYESLRAGKRRSNHHTIAINQASVSKPKHKSPPARLEAHVASLRRILGKKEN